MSEVITVQTRVCLITQRDNTLCTCLYQNKSIILKQKADASLQSIALIVLAVFQSSR